MELATVLATLGVCGNCEPAQITYTYSIATRGPVVGNVAEFGQFAQTVYDDPRGWSLNGKIRFRHVPTGGDYTLWLSSADQMASFSGGCSAAYSCRSGRNVVINDDRWSKGPLTPGWADNTDYRTEVVNHETGHWLGLGHTFCPPGGGVAATVMQQQSISLQGCKANMWPLPQERDTVAKARRL